MQRSGFPRSMSAGPGESEQVALGVLLGVCLLATAAAIASAGDRVWLVALSCWIGLAALAIRCARAAFQARRQGCSSPSAGRFADHRKSRVA